MYTEGSDSEDFRFAFDADEFQLFGWSIAIVEEELFARLNRSFRKNSDAMVAVDHDYLRVAVWIDGMICEANFVSFARCVHHEVVVEIEQEAASVLVVDLATTVCFVL